MAGEVHRWKTTRFAELAMAGEIPPQEGAERVLDSVAATGVTLAIATTGSRRWVEPLVEKLFGWDRFATVVTGEDVQRLKPDPEAYVVTLDRLGLGPADVVAIEDSGNGWRAARAAGIACLVVANAETSMDDVAGADLVIDGFGHDGYAPRVIADRFGVWSERWPDPAVLSDFLKAAAETLR
ncbi:MAG: HAD-IA family hydrolase [Actinomycetota bacterium]|nr:HAD-IA family hydrolase [Actinomycetota bacterium]